MRAWIPLVLLALAACGAPATREREPRDDCDGDGRPGPLRTWYADHDGDGYGQLADTVRACTRPAGYRWASAPDCDDTRQDVHPGATERCDGRDEDCDGVVDDHVPGKTPHYEDDDGDGWGGASLGDCTSEGVTQGGDCDDEDADRYPGADEICDDGRDQDCSGRDDDQAVIWYADVDGDGFGGGLLTYGCKREGLRQSDVGGDCDDTDPALHPGATWYLDADGDGYGDPNRPVVACSPPAGAVADPSDCDDTKPGKAAEVWAIDADGDGYGVDGVWSCTPLPGRVLSSGNDCDDSDPTAGPSRDAWTDGDGDGYGGTKAHSDCHETPGHVYVGGDCDDSSASVHPGATEYCDAKDDDCDGDVDEGGLWTMYADEDGDGYGDPAHPELGCTTYGGELRENALDCDDTTRDVKPGATELCNGVDDDCDGLVDGDDPDLAGDGTWYADGDGDGHGDPSSTVTGCDPPGYVGSSDDCDDADPDVHGGAEDSCMDGVDADCDGTDACSLEGVSRLYSDEYDDGRRLGVVAADLDGDGVIELAISDGWADALGRSQPGVAWVVPDTSLEAGGTLQDLSSGEVVGADAEGSGARLAVAGDLDGDGAADLAVSGKYGSDDAAWLLSGTAITGSVDLDTSAFAWVVGNGTVETAGDLDGDGADDVWIGGASWSSGTHRGGGSWAHGPLSGAVSSFDGSIWLGGAWETFAASLADADGDGDRDILVASSWTLDASTFQDTLFFFDPPSGDLTLDDADLESHYQLTAIGDVDGDGIGDVAELAAGNLRVWPGPVTTSALPAAALTVSDGGAADWDGVADAGDMDGDGFDELLLTGENASSDHEVWLFAGGSSGTETIDDAERAWVGTAYDGGPRGALGVGDVDGDGLDDVLLKFPYDDTYINDAGSFALLTAANL